MERQPVMRKNRAKWRGCVKKPLTEREAQKQMFILLVDEEHKDFEDKFRRWAYGFCEQCQAFHVVREK